MFIPKNVFVCVSGFEKRFDFCSTSLGRFLKASVKTFKNDSKVNLQKTY